jgi:hypothetical protein
MSWSAGWAPAGALPARRRAGGARCANAAPDVGEAAGECAGTAPEGYRRLAAAFEEADSGRIPTLPPCVCHSLTTRRFAGLPKCAAGADVDVVRPAQAGAAVRGAEQPSCPRTAHLRSESRTACGVTATASRVSRRRRPCVWRTNSACPPGASSTATCHVPPRPVMAVRGRSRSGGVETAYERSSCAARSRFRCALLW